MDNIATLAIKVKADIGQLQGGLQHAKRELDKFNKQIRESGRQMQTDTSQWGLIRAFKKGKDVGTTFGNDISKGIDKALSGPSKVVKLFNDIRQSMLPVTNEAKKLGSLGLLGLTGLGSAAVGAFRNIRTNGIRKPSAGSSFGLPNINMNGMLSTATDLGSKIGSAIYNGVKGSQFGKGMGSYIQQKLQQIWSKTTGKGFLDLNRSNVDFKDFFKLKGMTSNIAMRLGQHMETPEFLTQGSYAKQLEQLRNVVNKSPGLSKAKKQQINDQLSFESVGTRIRNSLGRGVQSLRQWNPDITGIPRKAFNYMTTKRDYTNYPTSGQFTRESPIMHYASRGLGIASGIAGVGVRSSKYGYDHVAKPLGSTVIGGATQAFKGLYNVASGIPGRLMSIFQTLNPFELFTRSLLAFKTTAVMALGAIGIASIRLSGQFEQFKIAFEALTGSKQLGEKTFAEMTQFATKTPFSIREVMAASQMLLGYGTAAEQLYPTLKMIGEVTSAIGNDYVNLQHVTYLFGTMQQQGHIFTRDVNQLANIGIPIYEALATVLKVNKQEIQGMVEAGKVGFPEMQQAFVNMTAKGSKFNGFMEKQSRSLLGLWRNTLDNLEVAGAKFGDVLVKEFDLKGLLTKAMAVTSNSDEFFYKYKDDIKDIVDLTKSLVGYAASFGMHLAAGFSVIKDIVSNTFPETVKYMEQMAKGGQTLSLSWSKAKETMLSVFESIAINFASMLDSIRSGIVDTLEMIRKVDPLSKNRTTEKEVINSNTLGIGKLHDQIYGNGQNNEGFALSVNQQIGQLKGKMDKSIANPNVTGNQYLDMEIKLRELEKKKADMIKSYNELLPKAKAQKDRENGLPDFTIDMSFETRARIFFDLQRKNIENNIKLEEQRMDIYHNTGPKAVTDMLMGGFAPAMRDMRDTMKFNEFDKVDLISNSAKTAGLGGIGSTALQRGLDKRMSNIDSQFNNISGLPLQGNKDDPDKRLIVPATLQYNHDQITLLDGIKKEISPLNELTSTLSDLRVLFNGGALTRDMYGLGVQDAYKKAASRIGDNDIKFASPAYKGSAEALKIEAEAKAGMYNTMNAQDYTNQILRDSLEVQKQLLEANRAIGNVQNRKDLMDYISRENNIWGPP